MGYQQCDKILSKFRPFGKVAIFGSVYLEFGLQNGQICRPFGRFDCSKWSNMVTLDVGR